MAALANVRHEQFCREYLIDLNGTQAAIRAGYAAKSAKVTAARLLTNANVAARIAELRAARTARTEVDADYVVANLRSVVERCMQREQVLSPYGQPVTPEFDADAAIAALKLLGHHVGMFAPTQKHEVSGPAGGPIPVKHEHVTVTAADVAAARAVLGVAGGDLHPDGRP